MSSTTGWHISPLAALSADEQSDVRELAHAVADLDGAEPLNEAALLQLAGVEAGVSHLVATSSDAGSALTGYAQLDLGSDGSEASAEVLAGPGDERPALADALLATAEDLASPRDVVVWSRGTSPVGSAASQRGYLPVRTLLEMRRPLASVPADRVWPPPGVIVRTFVPGQDDEEWLAVNAAAFAEHPEQGHWTATDLAERMAQPWFDPRDFFLARDSADGTLLGYHWTKLHPAEDGAAPLGEVYVLGVAPSAQGRRIGQILLEVGLRHLKLGPAEEVMLYVEQANAGAVRLYEKHGFTLDRRDVQYRLSR